jgi:hypothetical protein
VIPWRLVGEMRVKALESIQIGLVLIAYRSPGQCRCCGADAMPLSPGRRAIRDADEYVVERRDVELAAMIRNASAGYGAAPMGMSPMGGALAGMSGGEWGRGRMAGRAWLFGHCFADQLW